MDAKLTVARLRRINLAAPPRPATEIFRNRFAASRIIHSEDRDGVPQVFDADAA